MAPTAWHECLTRPKSVVFALPEHELPLHPSLGAQGQRYPLRLAVAYRLGPKLDLDLEPRLDLGRLGVLLLVFLHIDVQVRVVWVCSQVVKTTALASNPNLGR